MKAAGIYFQGADRVLVRAVKELASQREINYSGFSEDWIILLQRKKIKRFVYGFNFDLNTFSVGMIANDKAGLSDLLGFAGLPHVPHRFFMHPGMTSQGSLSGNWREAINYAGELDYDIVCKTNQGTGGSHVYRIRNQRELEAAFQNLYEVNHGLCVSPYYPIEREYRLILLHDRVLLAYEKTLPVVCGDGRSSFRDLVVKSYASGQLDARILASSLEDPPVAFDYIPPKDTAIPVLWKHNLGRGAGIRIIDGHEIQRLADLARDGMRAGGLSLAAVDIISSGNAMRILEINCGIMLENFARHPAGGYERARSVYAEILDAMFPE